MKRILLLLTCLFVVTAAAAPATTSYDIEVVVFENRLPSLEGGELFTQNGGATSPDVSAAVEITEPAATDTTLGGAVNALQRDAAYRILVHQRWRQTAEEKSATKPVRLRTSDGQLDGVLKFYMSRFLHVDVDVALKDKEAAAGTLSYRLLEHRRVKTQDTNYFDHPKLGMLLRVTAVGKE